MRVCAITNVYNEAFNLPIWLRYYGRQLGLENCLVIDHGSDDGSTHDLGGANRLRIPRVSFDDNVRAEMISGIANSMLKLYDAVLYTDCDEILVADPRKYDSLHAFCARMEMPSATAVGLNVIHHLEREAPIDGRAPLMAQRRYVQFVSPMCKTLLVREPVNWGGGFHSSNFRPSFGDLYLFHLRWLDLGESLRRLAVTRRVRFADSTSGLHQRASFMDCIKNHEALATLPVRTEGFDFSPFLARFLESVRLSHTNRWFLEKEIRSPELYVVPEAFVEPF